MWRALLRDVRVRRALSLAIDRHEINMAVFYGLGKESADTVLPESPLYQPEFAQAWIAHDPDQANALLDEIGPRRSATMTASGCCPTAARRRSSSKRPAKARWRPTCSN